MTPDVNVISISYAKLCALFVACLLKYSAACFTLTEYYLQECVMSTGIEDTL